MGILDELLASQTAQGGPPMDNQPAPNAPEPTPAPQNAPAAPKNPNFLRSLLTDFIGTLAGNLQSGSFQQAVGKGIQAGTARGGTAGQAFGAAFGGVPEAEMQRKGMALEERFRNAQIGELIARGKAHAQPAVGKTPEEQTLRNLMAGGENGTPQINPETNKPYTMLEAFSKIKQAAQDVKPLPAGEHPLGESVASINQTLTDRFQVLNPGETLPPQYTLGPDAKQKDYDRVDRALEQVERQKGTEAQRNTANAIRQQTFEMIKAKRDEVDEAMDIAAQGLVQPRNLTTLRMITSMREGQRLIIYARATKLDPNFDPGLIEQRVLFLRSYEDPKGRASINRQAINNILQHAGDLSELNKTYGRSDVRLINTAINKLSRQFGSTTYINYATTLGVLKDELTLYFAGGYAPVGEQHEMWNKILNEDATPAQVEAFTKEVVHLGLRRATTFNSQFKKNMGYDDPNMIIPEAKEAGERLGLGNEMQKFGSGGQLGGAQGGSGGRVMSPADWMKNRKP